LNKPGRIAAKESTVDRIISTTSRVIDATFRENVQAT
jgi:hypothetical protein